MGRVRAAVDASQLTIAATTLSPLPTPLALEVVLTGRPLEVTVTGTAAAGASGVLIVDVTLRGESISGVHNGLHYTQLDQPLGFTGTEIVMAPTAGRARLEVVALRDVSDGTIYVDDQNRLVLTAKEL